MLKVNTLKPTQISHKGKFIPLIPIEAMAGYGNGETQIAEADITEGYVIPEFEEKGVRYLIRVSGSSMYPKYSNGDLLGCKPISDLSFFQWGKPYVLDTNQGPLVKRLFPVEDKPDLLLCKSDNYDNYPPFSIHKSSIYRIAIIVGVLRME
jgi:phage repressor protein C with HTH and peptisase S24 domain